MCMAINKRSSPGHCILLYETRATLLDASPFLGVGGVDDENFSICYKNVGVMAISNEGYNPKVQKIFQPSGTSFF